MPGGRSDKQAPRVRVYVPRHLLPPSLREAPRTISLVVHNPISLAGGDESAMNSRGTPTTVGEDVGSRGRWVEWTPLAWLAHLRRLAIRYDRLANIHQALLHLGCSLICLSYPS